MPFPFTLLRAVLLSFIAVTNTISSALAVTAFHEKTGGVFQVLAICVNVLSLSTVIGCLYHQCAHQGEEASNTRNLCLFGICGLLGFVLAVSLTVHARQDGGMGICKDFVHAGNSCVLGGVQLGMAYAAHVAASVGFTISWIDKLPGAIRVTPRYPITKAPSSQFAAYAHDLDAKYTPPVWTSRSRDNSGWSDVSLQSA